VVEVAGAEAGIVGEIDPAVAAAHSIGERVALLEIDMGHLLGLPESVTHATAVSRYPSSDIDLAFVVDDVVPAAAVAATIHSAGGEDLEAVDLFDVFRSDAVGDQRRSLAYRIRFCAADRTLTDEEVGSLRAAIIDSVEATHGATLRG
jgi:phenylalanyl-tRNA synthetase beta chain